MLDMLTWASRPLSINSYTGTYSHAICVAGRQRYLLKLLPVRKTFRCVHVMQGLACVQGDNG